MATIKHANRLNELVIVAPMAHPLALELFAGSAAMAAALPAKMDPISDKISVTAKNPIKIFLELVMFIYIF